MCLKFVNMQLTDVNSLFARNYTKWIKNACTQAFQKALHKLHKIDVVQMLCKLLKSGRVLKKQVAENQPLAQNTTPCVVGMRRLERPTPTSRT